MDSINIEEFDELSQELPSFVNVIPKFQYVFERELSQPPQDDWVYTEIEGVLIGVESDTTQEGDVSSDRPSGGIPRHLL